MIPTDLLRILVGASVFAFAAITDLRWRRAPDACWWTIAAAGALLVAYDAWTTPGYWSTHMASLIIAALVLAMALIGYLTGLIAGGADAKAMMSLAILAPTPMGAGWTLPLASPFPLVLTVLINGLLVAMIVPLVIGVVNLARGDLAGFHTFLGFRVPLEKIDFGVVWPVEYIDEDGQRAIAYTPRSVPEEALDLDWLEEHGITEPWVTPKVPFLVPLLIGLVIAALAGDPAAWTIEQLAT